MNLNGYQSVLIDPNNSDSNSSDFLQTQYHWPNGYLAINVRQKVLDDDMDDEGVLDDWDDDDDDDDDVDDDYDDDWDDDEEDDEEDDDDIDDYDGDDIFEDEE